MAKASTRLAAKVKPKDWIGYAEIVVEAVVGGKGQRRRAAQHEQQAEGGENRLAFQLLAGARAAHQRQHQEAVDQPIGGESQRHRERQAENRIDAEQRVHKESGEGRAHQELAISEVHDARHAVLQIEADRDERVEPAQDHAAENDFDQRHAATRRRSGRPGARGWPVATGSLRPLQRAAPAAHHAGLGKIAGFAPGISAGATPTNWPFCHCPAPHWFSRMWVFRSIGPETVSHGPPLTMVSSTFLRSSVPAFSIACSRICRLA